jgi:hypothetical protein
MPGEPTRSTCLSQTLGCSFRSSHFTSGCPLSATDTSKQRSLENRMMNRVSVQNASMSALRSTDCWSAFALANAGFRPAWVIAPSAEENVGRVWSDENGAHERSGEDDKRIRPVITCDVKRESSGRRTARHNPTTLPCRGSDLNLIFCRFYRVPPYESADALFPSSGTPGEGREGGEHLTSRAFHPSALPSPPPDYRGREEGRSRRAGRRRG